VEIIELQNFKIYSTQPILYSKEPNVSCTHGTAFFQGITPRAFNTHTP